MDNVGNCLTDKKYRYHVEIYDKDDINARDFVDNFPTNFLRSITFLHPLGVCGWTFHRTELHLPMIGKNIQVSS